MWTDSRPRRECRQEHFEIGATISDFGLEAPRIRPWGVVYENFIGESLEVGRKDETLTVSGESTCDLIPLGGAAYASADDPDIAVRFEQLDGRGYTRVMVVVPFYWMEVYR